MRISADLADYRATVETYTFIPRFHSSPFDRQLSGRLANLSHCFCGCTHVLLCPVATLEIVEAVSASGSKLSVGYIAHVILDLLPVYSRESVRFGNSDGKRLVTLIGFRYIAEKKPVCFVISFKRT